MKISDREELGGEVKNVLFPNKEHGIIARYYFNRASMMKA